MKDPSSFPNLERVIRESVEQAVREAIAEQMPAIRAYASEQAKRHSPVAMARKKAGLNQADLAEATGLSQSSVSRIEAGQLSVSSEQAHSLAKVIVETGKLRRVGVDDLAKAILLIHGEDDDDGIFNFLDAGLKGLK
jgi:DNA-binding XRE family transcriptional regulator